MHQLTSEQKLEMERIAAKYRREAERKEERNRLIEENAAVVERNVRRYASRGVDVDDLIQEGKLGLLRAAEDFDPSFGVPFSAHAGYWVREFMRTAVANQGHAIRVPHQTIRKYSRVVRFRVEFAGRVGREPTDEEIEAATGVGRATMETISSCAIAISSESIEFEHLVADREPDDASEEEIVEIRRLHRAVAQLSEDQSYVLGRLFDLDREGGATMKQVAAERRVTVGRVAKIRDEALAEVKRIMEEAASP